MNVCCLHKLLQLFWIIRVYCKYNTNIPTEASRNLGPIRESLPTALATSVTSAPVASHTADSELILEILCARNAFAAYIHKNNIYNTIINVEQ